MFWGEFRPPLAALDRCTLNKGAFALKIVRGALNWPLTGGSRLIEVAATAGLTVYHSQTRQHDISVIFIRKALFISALYIIMFSIACHIPAIPCDLCISC